MRERVRDILEATAAEAKGPHADAVRASRRRTGRETGLASLQQEILGEMASALGRAEEHVTRSLAALAELDASIVAVERDVAAGCAEPSELDRLVVAYNDEHDVAERRLWELEVHREALGIRDHERAGGALSAAEAARPRHFPVKLRTHQSICLACACICSLVPPASST